MKTFLAFLISLSVVSCESSTRYNSIGYVKSHWQEYTRADRAASKVRLVGGVEGLTVYAYNDSDFDASEIKIKVDYIKQNGAVFKTEYVSVYNVPPHSSKGEPAPDSRRGTGVNVSVISASF